MLRRTIILLLLPTVINCTTNLEARNEKTFPNGTLIGKYTYVDSQGNKVQVKYFADRDSYGVDLKSFKIQQTDDQNSKTPTVTTETTTVFDKMVPLKLDLPRIENMYSIENPRNFTDDDTMRSGPENYDKNDQPKEYDLVNPVVNTSKTKTLEKPKRRGYKSFIRKIRQTLDIYMNKMRS